MAKNSLRSSILRLICCVCALCILLLCAGCSGSQTEQASSNGAAGGDAASFRNANLGCGWESESSMQLDYATNFTVDYYADGFKLVCLSDGSRYLAVPEGAEAPEGLSSDIVVIQQPLENIYLVASDTMCLFDALDAVDTISVSGIKQDDWYIQSAVGAMKKGDIVYGGKYNAPDYDLLLSEGVGFAIESTMINHNPEVKEKLETLGINVLTEQSSYESEPLGRTEWVKLYGALLNKEDKAEEVFSKQVESVKAVEGQDTDKTVAFFYINSNGAAVVRKPGDYVTKMIKAAGGVYIYDNLGDPDSSMSTVTLEMEKFYETAKDADFIVYNATIDGGIKSVDELVAMNSLLADFKAIQSGNVFCTDQNMYQQMVETGSIVSDFHTMLTDPDSSDMRFLYKLKS